MGVFWCRLLSINDYMKILAISTLCFLSLFVSAQKKSSVGSKNLLKVDSTSIDSSGTVFDTTMVRIYLDDERTKFITFINGYLIRARLIQGNKATSQFYVVGQLNPMVFDERWRPIPIYNDTKPLQWR